MFQWLDQHTRIKFTVSLTSWLWSRTLLEKPSGRSVSPNIYFSDMNGGGEIERRWLMLGVMHHNNPDSPWQADSCMTWRVMYAEPSSVAHCEPCAVQKLVWICVSFLHQISLLVWTETFDKHMMRSSSAMFGVHVCFIPWLHVLPYCNISYASCSAALNKHV